MARPQSRFVCQSCGESFLRWEGQCRACDGWNTLVETVVREPSRTERAIVRGAPAAASRHAVGLRRDRRGRPAATAARDRRARPRPGRRARARLARARRWRAGDRQVDAPAPGRGRADRRWLARSCTPPARNRRPGPPPGGATRPPERPSGGRRPGPRRDTTSAGSSRRLARSDPALVVVDSIQTATVDDLDGAAGSVGQVRESTAAADGARQGRRDRGRPGRPRHEGRLDRRTARPSSTSSTRSSTSRASATPRCASCGRRRTGSARPTRSASSRWPRPGCSRSPIPARAFLADHERRGAGQRRRADARGQPAAARRGPGARPPDRLRHARRARRVGHRPEPAQPAASRSSAGAPASALGSHDVYANLAGGLSRRRAGARPAVALALASSHARPADRARDRGDRRGRPARRAARRRRSRAPAARGRPARLRAGDRPAPATGRARRPPIDGLEVVRVATLRDAIEAPRCRTGRRPVARRVPAMLG